MIIVPEPVGENPASCLVGQVELGVGPLLQECADEALCLAVGLGSVGASGAVSDLEGGAGLLEYGGVRVAESPVGEDGLDLDTCVGEVDAGSGEGAGRCSAPLVHGHVQVFVAGAPTFGGRAAPEHLVTPAVRDAGQLLGVEGQELSRSLLLVADHLPGGAVQIGEAGEPFPAEHPLEGGTGEAAARSQHVGGSPAGPTCRLHASRSPVPPSTGCSAGKGSPASPIWTAPPGR